MALPCSLSFVGVFTAPQVVGDLIKQSMYVSASSALVDPTEVSFSYIEPAETPTPVELIYDGGDGDVTREAEGIYSVNLSLDTSGVWFIRWVVSGTYQGAAEYQITVADSAFD